MAKRTKIGPKGQIVIPKAIRDKLSIKEYSEVLIDLRGKEVIISRLAPISASYTDFFISTYAKKLKRKVDLKRVLDDEYGGILLH